MLAKNTAKTVVEEKDRLVKGMLRNCVYGICLRLKQHVLATHQELRAMRRCAELSREQSSRIIYVVAAANKQKTNFIVNTLQHLGVSCGQIRVSPLGVTSNNAQDVWLFVTQQ